MINIQSTPYQQPQQKPDEYKTSGFRANLKSKYNLDT
jgi:hypothetical protein